jgi:predicted transcriptional regulator
LSKRSRSDVIEAILRAIGSGAGQSLRIMYGAYVSYGQLEEYADFMVNQGLVYRERGSELYKLTPKGEEFLEAAEKGAQAPAMVVKAGAFQ